MRILGISAFVHDSGACLIVNGTMVANVEEERLNRIKHTNCFPALSIAYVLGQGGLNLADIDAIAFNWNPRKSLLAEILKFLFFPPIYLTTRAYNKPPKNFGSIRASLSLKRHLRRHFGPGFRGKMVWVDHHLAHAASTYYLAPFCTRDADVIVIDGHGDDCSTSVYSVHGNRFKLRLRQPILDSLGIVYGNFTRFLGFDEFQEGKTMALAAYGRDSYAEAFRGIIGFKPDGSYKVLNKRYLGLYYYLHGLIDPRLGPPRRQGEALEQRHFDLACSMQTRIKDAILHLARQVQASSGNHNLALAGGVFLNCDINRDILGSAHYARVFAPPFTSDCGGAAGAALYAAFARLGEPPRGDQKFSAYLGPAYNDAEISDALIRQRQAITRLEDPCAAAAAALLGHRAIGWFQGRMECGPRALGNRSILANPASTTIRDRLNRDIKRRELFRPFAPIVTRQAALRYFDLAEPLSDLTRYMLVTCLVRPQYRELLAGITHVDFTARIQLVEPDTNPLLHRLLVEFGKLSGFEVLINTSFNLHEPIVCSPDDAIQCYLKSGLDELYLGNYRVVAADRDSNSEAITGHS